HRPKDRLFVVDQQEALAGPFRGARVPLRVFHDMSHGNGRAIEKRPARKAISVTSGCRTDARVFQFPRRCPGFRTPLQPRSLGTEIPCFLIFSYKELREMPRTWAVRGTAQEQLFSICSMWSRSASSSVRGPVFFASGAAPARPSWRSSASRVDPQARTPPRSTPP